MSRVLQRLVVWLAFAGAMLAPALARAALIPACDGYDQLTRMPAPSALPSELPLDEACSVAALGAVDKLGDELGDVRVAAMCDDRGASVIAPQRILPIVDARLEAAPGEGRSAQVIGPGPEHPPVAAGAAALADHAVLDALSLIPPPSWELVPCYPPVTGGPRAGFGRRIDHPPR